MALLVLQDVSPLQFLSIRPLLNLCFEQIARLGALQLLALLMNGR